MFPYLTLITHGIVATVAFAAAWVYQANSYKAEIAQITVEHTRSAFRALETAHAQTVEMQGIKDAAIKKAQTRAAENARAAESARAALRLSDNATSDAIRAANTSNAACIAHVTALGSVFRQCSQRLVEMGERATGHATDVQTLMDAWPRNEKKPQAESTEQP